MSLGNYDVPAFHSQYISNGNEYTEGRVAMFCSHGFFDVTMCVIFMIVIFCAQFSPTPISMYYAI